MAEIVVKHEGIAIQYDEVRNRWEVDDENHGVTLSRQSLEEAKKGIDQALKNKGKGRFARFKAWTKGSWGTGRDYVLVTVTSMIERDGPYSSNQAWVTYPSEAKGRRPSREKMLTTYLYKDTARNRQRIQKINELHSQMRKLEDKYKKIEEKLDTLEVKEKKA